MLKSVGAGAGGESPLSGGASAGPGESAAGTTPVSVGGVLELPLLPPRASANTATPPPMTTRPTTARRRLRPPVDVRGTGPVPLPSCDGNGAPTEGGGGKGAGDGYGLTTGCGYGLGAGPCGGGTDGDDGMLPGKGVRRSGTPGGGLE